MAKISTDDLDSLDFSFGASTVKATTAYTSTVSTASTTSSTITAPIVTGDDTNDVVADKTYISPQVIPEGSSDAWDSRYQINTKDDITAHTMWNTMSSGGKIYSSVYQGMQVYLRTTKEIMVYVGPTTVNGVLLQHAVDLNNWLTLKTTANMDKIITAVSINHKYYSIAEQSGTSLNIDMAGTKVPYKDNFVTAIDVDYIRAMMGDDSIQVGDDYPDITSIVNNIYNRIEITGNDI